MFMLGVCVMDVPRGARGGNGLFDMWLPSTKWSILSRVPIEGDWILKSATREGPSYCFPRCCKRTPFTTQPNAEALCKILDLCNRQAEGCQSCSYIDI